MRCLAAVILAVLLVMAEGKVVPRAASDVATATDNENQQAAGTQSLQLSDHIKQAQDAINNLGAQIQRHLPNHEEVLHAIQEQSTNLANNVQTYLKNVTDEIKAKSPELENIWTNMKSKLSETIDNLNVNPETTEQVNQLRAKFQEGVQTLVTESENTAKSISENSSKVQEDFAKFVKQAVDIAVQASQNLNNQLQQATTPAPQPQN